ncbi:NAD-glutamate dehydrogenase [Oceanibacterium hippocampi]|uniref:NAD-specific glutamate dehydrogenase n=1 Tax=Oceanibacterium hippocampi TaxID=745714 RepID=A0A1Y5RJ20_9PROT|nr:NAD-glutamate dehydrogenase [Oceanibacterium hippocampi]SLN15900.1 NAD-specific glutamate dehydrogenase [Oceanibacterium hippocampi]
MLVKAKEQKIERLKKVAALASERLDKAQAAEFGTFLAAYYERVSVDDVLAFSTDALYGSALSLFRFSAQRKPGETKIRIFNPSIEGHGWKSPHTVIELVNDDMPFLVDSVAAVLSQRCLAVHLTIHPIMAVRRDKDGKRTGPVERGAGGKDAILESVMHVEIDEQSHADVLAEIETLLVNAFDDVRLAVADWRAMLDKVREVAQSLKDNPPPLEAAEVEEGRALLDWMADNHFTFLGFREYNYSQAGGNKGWKIVGQSGLGILRDPERRIMRGRTEMSPEVQEFLHRPELLIVTKANKRSTVHRPVHLDYVGVKKFDKKGKVTGEYRFTGLFTSAAYNRSPREIPFLRRKISRILERSGLAANSHDGKALLHVLESYPRDELFQIDEGNLFEIANGIVNLQERPKISLFLRPDRFARFVSALIYVPRERYNTELRKRFEGLLAAAFDGRISANYTQIGDEPLARLHVIVAIDKGVLPDVDPEQLEAQLVDAARDWRDDLAEALVDRWGEERGLKLKNAYGDAFPVAYREAFNAQLALFDIEKIEGLVEGAGVAVNLYRQLEDEDSVVRFKIYKSNDPAPLSDCLPMLEDMGLKVIEEHPYEIDRGETVWIHDFRLVNPTGRPFDLPNLKAKFELAFGKVWTGEIESDGFNRLVIQAGLDWRHVVVLRAYCKYLRQVGITFSQDYMEDVLADNPAIALLLAELFDARFNPENAEMRDQETARINAAITAALDQVASLDSDRILRRFANLINVTLRTNYHQRDETGAPKSYLSFKLDSLSVDELPLPRPFKEIFVYSPRVEGVHLRGGEVARGGLRWSDRREDFRTEVLGLMKAQMTKNAVIVPVGSKGGFVPKRLNPAGSREETLEEGIACYKIFISALLDITDNLSGGAVVPPADVVRHDGDDPYLVVAADKGTATFSDIANGVAISYGFWLGDAFASGGAAGYDHKKMGITARGAWESVKRHFRELGRDIQSEDFTVAGVGDMSGDVFGNGMLQSRHIRLVAAFDHRHVFIDPTPDPEKSYVERKRLFELPRSSWADYDTSLLSPGGKIVDRKLKSVALTPEIKACLGISTDHVTPNELIAAVLAAPVDLLWFGGIGTYVKATRESHADAGDRANDVVRRDARDIRAKVMGEGGNLAVTQRGRIEYALAGGRLNTDAIDNSAGVDCSDHEVNIKILLNAVVDDGELTIKQRDRLLAQMTDEVAELVLRDNYLQTQALTLAELKGVERLEEQARFMRGLEREGRLSRAIEFLPDDEVLAERAADHIGLTRPEMSVLLAYAKMTIYSQFLESDLPDDKDLADELVRYFPAPLQKKYRKAIENHRLHREIVATVFANSIVNRAGIAFVRRLEDEEGAKAPQVARAYAVVRQAFDLRPIWEAIEGLDNKVPAEIQGKMLLATQDLLHFATRWAIGHMPAEMGIAEAIALYQPGVQRLTGKLEDLLSELGATQLETDLGHFKAAGVPEELARRVASLEPLRSALDIVEASRISERPIEEVGEIYFAVGARLGLDWLRIAAERVVGENHWERLATSAIVDDLYMHQRALTSSVFRLANGHAGLDALGNWADHNQRPLDRTIKLIADFKASGGVDIPKLALANRQIRSMILS